MSKITNITGVGLPLAVPEEQEINKAEMEHRFFKTLKLAGVLAFVDQGQNFYVAKDGSGKHMPLPGFTMINDLCLLTTEQELSAQETEEKVVKLWNREERAEKNTRVPCLTELHGKSVKVALLRKIVNKRVRTDSGEYKPTSETVTLNTVDKFLYSDDGRTVLEIQNGVKTAEFAEAWMTRNDGKDRDESVKTETAGTSGTGRPGAPASGGSAASKLFG